MSSSFYFRNDEYCNEVNDVHVKEINEFNILRYWKNNSQRFQKLSRMAKDFLATPASSVPSESVFSESSRVINKYRNNLGENLVESLVCLKSWIENKIID